MFREPVLSLAMKFANTPPVGIGKGHVFHGSHRSSEWLVCMFFPWEIGPGYALRYHRRNPRFFVPMRELGPFWGFQYFKIEIKVFNSGFLYFGRVFLTVTLSRVSYCCF